VAIEHPGAPARSIFENRPDSKAEALRDLAELWAYREVVFAFAARTVRVRYKESFLGVLWVVLQPLALFIPFVIVLGRVAHIKGGGVPYAAFAAAVVVPWQFVANALSTGSLALVGEGPLVRKVYFPRSAPVAGAVLAAGFDLAVGSVLSVILVAVLGGHVRATVLLLPVMIVPLVVVAFAMSLVLAGLYVHYRDIRFVLPLVTQVLLYASPIAYPITVIPHRWQLAYCFLNPLAGPLDAIRRCVALGQAPHWSYVGASVATTAVVAVVALAAFGRLQSDVADLV
jgi:lipopolysaccharide transport system permease protein